MLFNRPEKFYLEKGKNIRLRIMHEMERRKEVPRGGRKNSFNIILNFSETRSKDMLGLSRTCNVA